MPDLSVKGIARRYHRRTAPFRLKKVFGITSGDARLRPILESLAREEHSFPGSEDCEIQIYDLDAKFVQIWTHIIVRIKLNFHPTILETSRKYLMTTWRDWIERLWSSKWGCSIAGEGTCRLTFEVQWTSDNPHYTIPVDRCTEPFGCVENSQSWFNVTTGLTVAHEFGHLLGLKDEYIESEECPIRNPVNTGTIMDTLQECFPARLMTRFADNIGSEIVGIHEYTHDPAHCT
jgi:hypothetical protein